MDDVQALWLHARLSALESDIEQRSNLCRLYDSHLERFEEWVQRPITLKRSHTQRTVDYVYLIEVPQRDALASFLATNGVGTEAYYPLPLHLQPICKHLGYRSGAFPVAELAATRALGLPLYPDMAPEDVALVCEMIGDFFAQRGETI